MAAVSSSVALSTAYESIKVEPGSPYLQVSAIIKCGGKNIIPHKVVDVEIGQDFTVEFADSIYLTVEIGLGDALYSIAPYAEDIRVSLQMMPMDENLSNVGGMVLKRTYTAYLASEVPSPSAIGGNPLVGDIEEANRRSFIQLAFKLEETSLVQFKRMSYGAVFEDTVPLNVALMFLNHAKERLKVSKDEAFQGIDVVAPDNKELRSNIVVPDGTQLMDIPDHIQNKEGGIYSTGLGFYLTGAYIYIWPLYNTERNQKANRILRCYIAPDERSGYLDHTWRVEGRRTEIWCKPNVVHKDDKVGKMNQEGTGTRYANSGKMMNGFAEVGDGKLVVERGENVNEFAYMEPVTGQQNIMWGPNSSSNTFYISSVMAKRRGSLFQVIWDHSHPTLLVPNMSVEIVYSRGAVAKKIMAALVGTLTKVTTMSDRFLNRGSISQTVILFFVSESDPMYQDWIESGAVGKSEAPQID